MTDAPQAFIRIARLGSPHGVRGELRLFSLSDVPGRLEGLRAAWWLGARSRRRRLEVEGVRAAGRSWLIKFRGIDTPEAARELVNGFLAVPPQERGTLPRGRYFVDDLIGLEVLAEDGRYLGRLEQIYETGANDVYAVVHEGRELLLPALAQVILEVDLEHRRLRVRVPAGLEP